LRGNARVNQCAEKHVSGDAGKTIERGDTHQNILSVNSFAEGRESASIVTVRAERCSVAISICDG
jgi:hypothetical protein